MRVCIFPIATIVSIDFTIHHKCTFIETSIVQKNWVKGVAHQHITKILFGGQIQLHLILDVSVSFAYEAQLRFQQLRYGKELILSCFL